GHAHRLSGRDASRRAAVHFSHPPTRFGTAHAARGPVLARRVSRAALRSPVAQSLLLGLRRQPPDRRARREQARRGSARNRLPAAVPTPLSDPPPALRRLLRAEERPAC